MKQLLPLLFLFCACRTGKPYTAVEKDFIHQQDSLIQKCHNLVDCPCSRLPPWTLITEGLANKRFNSFERKKQRTGQTATIDDGILYEIGTIRSIIDTVTAKVGKKKRYDGLRIYFATYPDASCRPTDSGFTLVPKDKYGTLTLIFVPTT